MESRIHGDMYVRFGGRLVETYHRKVEKRCWPSLLKEIADFCGIKKNLTTHAARHTFRYDRHAGQQRSTYRRCPPCSDMPPHE